jgi:glucose 1-dehydrogenase
VPAEGGEAIAMGANVAKEDEVLAMFNQTYQHFGTINILVNNAGLQKDSAFVDNCESCGINKSN